MIKQSIRLVGCIIALFALILVFKHSHLMQEEKPLNTTERFNIAVLSTTISKERLVNELNALVDQYGAVLVKVVPNQDNSFWHFCRFAYPLRFAGCGICRATAFGY